MPEYKDTNYYRNYIFMSQGNLFSTLQYNPAISSLRPYLVSPLTNIAEHFRSIGQPVPPGFESFNAVGEAYDLKYGYITYFVISVDGTRYSFFGLRGPKGPLLKGEETWWRHTCDSSVEDCSSCRDNYCPISRIKNNRGEQVFL